VIEPEDLVLMAGDDGAAGPVAVVAELIRELGAHAVVVALVSGRASGGTPPDLDGLMRVATGHRAARETPALSLDLGTAIDALTGVDTELGGPGTRRGGGREARWRPPSRGNGSGGKGEEPPPGPDRDLPTDRVHFTVTAPARVRPGAFFVLDLWAHLDAQREEVLERAREAAEGDLWSRTKGPVEVARGTVLTVRLRVEGLEVDEPEDSLLWDGEIANASFPVFAPREVEPGEARGLATVHAGGLQVAKVHFAIRVEGGTGTVDAEPTATGTALHRRAFASYASADRDGVLGRIQGMQKIAPGLEVFLDVLSLRSGQDWAAELERVIPEHDVFYLFWSEPASRSEWVEREWRWALRSKGVDFIDPVPLVSPREVPPPKELGSRHFNDWVLAFMSGRAGRG
jgi:hypothetical protein